MAYDDYNGPPYTFDDEDDAAPEDTGEVPCSAQWVADTFRPIQTGLFKHLDDETIPHAVRHYICEAGDALGRAITAMEEQEPNAEHEARL